jgi:hypothetical protein
VHNTVAPANSTNAQNASQLTALHKTTTASSKEIVVSAAGSVSRIVTLTAALQIQQRMYMEIHPFEPMHL